MYVFYKIKSYKCEMDLSARIPQPNCPFQSQISLRYTHRHSLPAIRIMSKAITPPDEYVPSLSAELYAKAEQELRETEASRAHALQAMRDWCASNARITTCRLDARFLLRFLRAKKFSLPMAQESLERYLLLRKSYNGQIFTNMNIQLQPLGELLAAGYMFALPGRDALGRRIIMTRPRVFDPSRHINMELLKIHGLTYEVLMECEQNQIRGVVHVVDVAGVGMPYMTIFTPKEAARIVKNSERTLPMRHKEIIGVNLHGSIRFAVDFALSIVSEKMRKRIKFCSLPELGQFVDVALLPKEYGGVQPMAEMIGKLCARCVLLCGHRENSVCLQICGQRSCAPLSRRRCRTT